MCDKKGATLSSGQVGFVHYGPMPVLALYCFLLVEKDEKNISLTTKAKAKPETFWMNTMRKPMQLPISTMSRTNLQGILSNHASPRRANEAATDSDRNRKLQQGEAPSRAFPRHTSKMGRSWCQPTLLCMLKSDVCQQSSFSAWGAALHIQIAPTPEQIWTSLNNQRLLILCVTNVQAPSMEPRVRTTTAPYCFNWPWRMFTQCNNPTALLAAFGARLWWHPHKCRSKSRSGAAWLWGGEARDIRWRPLRNLKRMTSLQEIGKW